MKHILVTDSVSLKKLINTKTKTGKIMAAGMTEDHSNHRGFSQPSNIQKINLAKISMMCVKHVQC